MDDEGGKKATEEKIRTCLSFYYISALSLRAVVFQRDRDSDRFKVPHFLVHIRGKRAGVALSRWNPFALIN